MDQNDTTGGVLYEAYFWHQGRPWDVKFEIEKSARMLLARGPGEPAPLVFTGKSGSGDPSYRARFCFEAASPDRLLYSLRLDAAYPRKFFTEEKIRQLYTDRAFARWIQGLQLTTAPGSHAAFSPILYQQLVAETLTCERELADRREDEAPIAAVRQAVLAALRAGKKCGSANKEGQTSFHFNGTQFVRDHVGEEDELQLFAGDAEVLADLRKFYDWDTKRDTYPHPPPELDVWRFIERKLS
jgi:hypothetical protein